MPNDADMGYLGRLARAWRYCGVDGPAGDSSPTGEVVQSETSKRPLAVNTGGYRRLAGALAEVGQVGLIQPKGSLPLLVRREISRNGIEYLAEL